MSTTTDAPVILLMVLVLALTSCIATGVVKLPGWIVDSTFTTVILVILSLGGFSKDPMLGLSFFLLTAVVLFNRNVRKTTTKLQNFAPDTEEEDAFFDTPQQAPQGGVVDAVFGNNGMNDVMSHSANVGNNPNSQLDQFIDQHRPASDGSVINTALGAYGETTIPRGGEKPVGEYSTFKSSPRGYNEFNETSGTVEGFVSSTPSSFSDLGTPTDGQYPVEEQRVLETADTRDYTYRPDEDTGSNTFERIGPDLDEKKAAFQYK